MATTTTSKTTNVQALSDLLTWAKANGYPNADALGKMEHHLAQLAKPKAKPEGPSKTQRLNAALVEEVYAYLCEKGSVTSKSLIDGLGSPYVTTSQKASVLLGMLVADGRAMRDTDHGRAVWSVVQA